MDPMKPEDRDALMMKVMMKLKDMSDEDLANLAEEINASDSADQMDTKSEVKIPAPDMEKPVVDTGVLSGPIPALKNFLIKKQRDNDDQA